MSKNSEYKDITLIDIVVKNTKDIFQQFGHSPLGSNILNRDFEDYILTAAKSCPLEKKIGLAVYMPCSLGEEKLIEPAIHKHFENRARQTSLHLKEQFKQWAVNMVIGVLFLVLCLILVEILEVFSYINIIKIIKESLLIIGWVALWEPVTFILFGWRIIKRDKLLYKKLARMPISIEKW
jgi:hypothetical protein